MDVATALISYPCFTANKTRHKILNFAKDIFEQHQFIKVPTLRHNLVKMRTLEKSSLQYPLHHRAPLRKREVAILEENYGLNKRVPSFKVDEQTFRRGREWLNRSSSSDNDESTCSSNDSDEENLQQQQQQQQLVSKSTQQACEVKHTRSNISTSSSYSTCSSVRSEASETDSVVVKKLVDESMNVLVEKLVEEDIRRHRRETKQNTSAHGSSHNSRKTQETNATNIWESCLSTWSLRK